MLHKFKNLKWKTLLIYVFVTMIYPVAKALISDKKLLVFCDVLAIIGAILLGAGVIYSLILHGDFDLASFSFLRGRYANLAPSYETYLKDRKEKREDAFNYPLFLGIVYLVISAFIGYVLL